MMLQRIVDGLGKSLAQFDTGGWSVKPHTKKTTTSLTCLTPCTNCIAWAGPNSVRRIPPCVNCMTYSRTIKS